MAERGGRGGGGDGREAVWIIGSIVFVGLIWLLWEKARGVFVYPAFALDLVQVELFNLLGILGETGQAYRRYIWAPFTGELDPSAISWADMKQVEQAIGAGMQWPVTILIACMTLIIIFRMKGDGFKREFSLLSKKGPSLAHYQAEHWRVIRPSLAFNPDAGDPLNAPQLTPTEWMKKNNIKRTVADGIEFEAAKKAFEKQLGEPWPGLMKCPVHIQALAVMCYNNAVRSKNNRKIKEDLAVIYAGSKNPEKAVARYIKPYLSNETLVKTIDKHAGKHAYVTTAMYRLLTIARDRGGVFASAEFRWLKTVDRNLWYVLNNVGRRSYHVEGAGPVFHFFVEFMSGQRTMTPHVEGALEGLEAYLDENGIYDIEEFFKPKDDF